MSLNIKKIFEKEMDLYSNPALSTKLKSHDTQFAVVQGKIAAIISDAEIEEYIDSGTTMHSELANLVLTVGQLSLDFTDLDTKYDTLSGKYTQLDSKVAEYKASVDGLSAEISEVHTQYTQVSQNVTKNTNDISSLGSTLQNDYSTTAQMDSAIGANASETLQDAKTYANAQASAALGSANAYAKSAADKAYDNAKSYAYSQADEAKKYAGTMAANASLEAEEYTDLQLRSYSTTEVMNAAISESRTAIEAGVSHTYVRQDTYTAKMNNIDVDIESIFTWQRAADLKITEEAIVATVTASNTWTGMAETVTGNTRKLGTLENELKNLDPTARNIFINTLVPDVSAAAKLPRLREQGQDTYLSTGVSANTVSAAEHGFRMTLVAAARPRIAFGYSYGTMQGLEAGKKYTMSFDYTLKLMTGKTTLSTDLRISLYEKTSDASYASITNTKIIETISESTRGVELSGRCTWTFSISDNAERLGIFIEGRYTSSSYYAAGDFVELRNIMLVEGERAASWTPAPEDMASSSELALAKSEIIQNANNIALKVSATDYNGATIASLINQSASTVQIEAGHISLAGKTINLTSENIAISATNFSVDKDGNLQASNAHLTGADIDGIITSTVDKQRLVISEALLTGYFYTTEHGILDLCAQYPDNGSHVVLESKKTLHLKAQEILFENENGKEQGYTGDVPISSGHRLQIRNGIVTFYF